MLVGPNSGYGENDNRALLDAIKNSHGRFKGMAVVDSQCSLQTLQALKAQGVVGVTFNVAFYGVEHFRHAHALLEKLKELDLISQLQVTGEQLLPLQAMFRDAGTKSSSITAAEPIRKPVLRATDSAPYSICLIPVAPGSKSPASTNSQRNPIPTAIVCPQ